MSRSLAFRMTLKELGAAKNTIEPALQVEVGLSLAEGSTGQGFSVEDSFREMQLAGVTASLHVAEENELTEGTFIAFGQPAPSTFWQQTLRPNREEVTVTLLFPLTFELLRRIEERRGGKKPRFQVHADVLSNSVAEHKVLMVPPNPPNLGSSNALGWSNLEKDATFKETRLQPFPNTRLRLMGDRAEWKPATIEISRWIEILQELNFATYRLYEIPSARVDLALAADEHVDAAFRHFQRGDWRNCLGEARAANESMIRALRDTVNPVHADSRGDAEEKVQRVVKTAESLYEAMLQNQGAWLGMAAAGSHPAQPGTQVEKADAELALNQVVAFRQYVGRRFSSQLR